jgi:hypothetical protein
LRGQCRGQALHVGSQRLRRLLDEGFLGVDGVFQAPQPLGELVVALGVVAGEHGFFDDVEAVGDGREVDTLARACFERALELLHPVTQRRIRAIAVGSRLADRPFEASHAILNAIQIGAALAAGIEQRLFERQQAIREDTPGP